MIGLVIICVLIEAVFVDATNLQILDSLNLSPKIRSLLPSKENRDQMTLPAYALLVSSSPSPQTTQSGRRWPSGDFQTLVVINARSAGPLLFWRIILCVAARGFLPWGGNVLCRRNSSGIAKNAVPRLCGSMSCLPHGEFTRYQVLSVRLLFYFQYFTFIPPGRKRISPPIYHSRMSSVTTVYTLSRDQMKCQRSNKLHGEPLAFTIGPS